MKKFDLIHTTVLIVAILIGYMALQYVVSAISAIAFSVSSNYAGSNLQQVVTGYLVIAAFFAAAAFVLIKNGRKCTDLILRYDPETEFDDAPKFDLDRGNLLFVLFIGIGLYVVIQALPNALYNIWMLFSTKISPSNSNAPVDGSKIALELLRVTIGALLIYAAPNLTSFIENKIAARGSSSIQSDKTDV